MNALTIRAIAPIALAASLLACGGGGDGAAGNSPAPSTTITGQAVKGPVSGASISAHSIASGIMGTQLGQAVTGSDGSYTLTMAPSSGPMLLRMTGGTYVDEATGAVVTMPAGFAMMAVLPSLPSGTAQVHITPLTSMAQAMAASMQGGMTPANIDLANSAVGGYFGVADLLRTMPMNPLAAGSSATATQAMVNYGIALAGMSQYARDRGVPSSTMVATLMTDATDGVLDGKAGTAPVALGGMTIGGIMYATSPAEGLASAMLDFMASGANRSGASAPVVAGMVQQLRTSGGMMR